MYLCLLFGQMCLPNQPGYLLLNTETVMTSYLPVECLQQVLCLHNNSFYELLHLCAQQILRNSSYKNHSVIIPPSKC